MRKRAHELASMRVTPSELISADKALVERVASDDRQPCPPVRSKRVGNIPVSLLIDVVFGCGPVVMIATLVFGGSSDSLAQVATAVLLVCFAWWYQGCLAKKNQLTRLELLTEEFVESDCSDIEGKLKQALDQRKELQHSLNLLASSSPVSLFCLDRNLFVLVCNLTAARELNIEPDLLEGRQLLDFVHADDRERFFERFKMVCSSTAAQTTFEARVVASAGRLVDMRWSVDFSASGDCFFVCAENICAEKTLQRVKQEFVAMIGHDINTPLGSVIMNVTALEEGVYGPLSDRAVVCVRGIGRSLGRMVALLKELLDYEKTVAGKAVLEKEFVDLQELIEDSVSDFSGDLEHRRIAIKLELTRARVCVDVYKIFRVLLNLISNAIKYSPSDSVLTIKMVGSPNSVEVRISDMGPGIAREHQASIFERFNRVHSEANKKVQGTGLGLPIAKAIVEAHGGLIGVESTAGNGSTFWFALPKCREEQ